MADQNKWESDFWKKNCARISLFADWANLGTLTSEIRNSEKINFWGSKIANENVRNAQVWHETLFWFCSHFTQIIWHTNFFWSLKKNHYVTKLLEQINK
jgi:hypothetical protein